MNSFFGPLAAEQLVAYIFIFSCGSMFVLLGVPFLIRCLILYNELMIKSILFA